MKVFNTTVAKNAPDATLATHGPLTLRGGCGNAAGNTLATLELDTSENNTIVADQDSARDGPRRERDSLRDRRRVRPGG